MVKKLNFLSVAGLFLFFAGSFFAGLFLFIDYISSVSADVTQSGSAMNHGKSASPNITHDLSIEENDVVVAFVHVKGNQRITDNNGSNSFTEEIDNKGAGSNGHAIYTRVAGASEPATYQWTTRSSDRWSVEIRVFKTVDTSAIWEVAPSATTRGSGHGTTATAPSMTLNTIGAMGILFVFSDTPSQSFTHPTNSYSDKLEALTLSQATYTRTWQTLGATGQASTNLLNKDWMIYQVALRPGIAGPDVTPPFRSNGEPRGELPAETASTTITLTTNEAATCKYSIVPDTDYASMTQTFTTTGGPSHSTVVSGLLNNNIYNYYVRCVDAENNANTTDFPITFSIAMGNEFHNETVTSGLNFPVSLEFMPGGELLVLEWTGKIWILQPGASTVDPTPFLEITNLGTSGEQGLMDVLLDPSFTTNGYYYIYYTANTPNRNRISRFTADGTATIPSSEVVIWEDNVDAGTGHHGGQIDFGPDGKIYLSIGDNRSPSTAQSLTSFRGKILRMNSDGTIPTDNPFYDGNGPNLDAIWALGLRNPFRASFDSVSGRYYIADLGANAFDEVNLGAAGANYGWPTCEGSCGAPGMTNPIFDYQHPGTDTSITGGFVYRGSQFPSTFYGSYFFGDYAQNLIKRLTLSPDGTTVTGVFNFERPDGTPEGPYGDIVHLIEGPDGALYYADLGFVDHPEPGESRLGLSKIRRIRYEPSNQSPVTVTAATPVTGLAPLTVNFSSDGSFDSEGQSLSYLWTFGDGTASTEANPVHAYQQSGLYSAILSLSDGVLSTLSDPISIVVGSPPRATILSPADGGTFRAGDSIPLSGKANDIEDGGLGASAFTWDVLFHHDTHIHPELHVIHTTSGTLEIPTTGHDFSDNASYEIILTVIDSDGTSTSESVFIYPEKVDVTLDTVPSGLTLIVDGISRSTPLVLDALVDFDHVVEAVDQSEGTNIYNFVSWSDGGAQQHTLTAPDTATHYIATYDTVQNPDVIESGNAMNHGISASPIITHGLTIEENDVIVAFVHVNGNHRITDNNGSNSFTEEIHNKGVDTNVHAIYTRVAGASEPATYQWTTRSSDRWSVEIRVFKTVDTSAIWEVAPSATTRGSGHGTTATAPSMTLNTIGAMGILFVFSDTPSQSFSHPTNSYSDKLEALSQPQATYTRTWQTIGATGQASTNLLNNNDWMIYQVALRPGIAD